MADKNFVYITTTLPYVNSDAHLGFALEIIQADSFARYQRLIGNNVFFNFGTDEHGLKIYRKAIENNKTPQEYVDEYAKRFGALKESLNLSYDNFIRTTDTHHLKAAQEFWKLCDKNGDIYKKNYKQKYCVGCELEKTDSELIDGHCPLHPKLDIEIIEEENYFFRFSKYQKPLLDLYTKNPDFVIPAGKFNEIKSFVKEGLQDFSISRLASKMPWGIPVPDDPDHVMFVWFDALVNYISAIGWPDDKEKFEKWWPVIQFAGKDNLRQQTATWQAMLMSAGLSNSKQVFIHGFITVNGQKISKSLGNTIDPIEVAKKYGTDALRYYLLAKINPYEDSDFTFEKFEEVYNGNLANGLGNLIARIMQLAETNLEKGTRPEPVGFPDAYVNAINNFEFNKALDYVWSLIQKLDTKITETEPFRLIKTDTEAGKKLIFDLTQELYFIGRLLNPFLPETNTIIKEAITTNTKPKSLFPRI